MGSNVFYFLAQEADGSEVSMDAEQKMDGIRPIQNKVCNMNTPLYVCMLDIFFRQIITFIKVCMAFVYGLQTLELKYLSKIYQLKCLKPKNKGHTNFYECCDLMEKVYLMRTFKIAPHLIRQTASPYTQKHPKNIFVFLNKNCILANIGKKLGEQTLIS